MEGQLQYQELTGPVFAPAPVGFDPALLSWVPVEPHRQPRVSDRGGVSYAQPVLVPVAAYDPSGLQWRPERLHRAPIVPRGTLGHFAIPPQQAAPAYDPSKLEWQPKGARPGRQLAVVRVTYAVTDPLPVADAPPFDPSGLQWISILRSVPRSLPRLRITYTVADLVPRGGAPPPAEGEITPGWYQPPLLGLRTKFREPSKLRKLRREIRLLTESADALRAALGQEELAEAKRLAAELQLELAGYLERRQMMQVIVTTLLMLEE